MLYLVDIHIIKNAKRAIYFLCGLVFALEESILGVFLKEASPLAASPEVAILMVFAKFAAILIWATIVLQIWGTALERRRLAIILLYDLVLPLGVIVFVVVP